MIDILYGVVKLFSSINRFLIFRGKMFDFRRVLLLSLLFIKYDYVEISTLIPGVAGLITSPLLTYPYNLVSFPQQFPGSYIYIYILILLAWVERGSTYLYSWHRWREAMWKLYLLSKTHHNGTGRTRAWTCCTVHRALQLLFVEMYIRRGILK